MDCDAWPQQWMPDSRAFIAAGVESCDDWRRDTFIVPIDGSPARRLALPPNHGYTITPDGRNVLVAADDPKVGSLVAYGLSTIIGASPNRGKRTTSGTP